VEGKIISCRDSTIIVACQDFFDGIRLAVTDLKDKSAAGFKKVFGILTYSAIKFEAVGAAVKGRRRLTENLAGQGFHLGRVDVRGVGDNQVKGVGSWG